MGSRVSISILSNTLGEQYSIKNFKEDTYYHPFYVVNPCQVRGLPKCFDYLVKELPEIENDICQLFCPTQNLQKLIAQMFHGITNSIRGRYIFCLGLSFPLAILFIWLWKPHPDLNLFWAFHASLE